MNIKQTLKQTALGAAAVATLGAATLAASSADAHPHGGAGVAIGAGILGLAIGASLAHPAYGPGPYYGGPAYGYGYGYGYGCRSFWHWSPRWGRYVRVERCY
jgi:hypothetical protein